MKERIGRFILRHPRIVRVLAYILFPFVLIWLVCYMAKKHAEATEQKVRETK